jgi:hypothetical protein
MLNSTLSIPSIYTLLYMVCICVACSNVMNENVCFFNANMAYNTGIILDTCIWSSSKINILNYTVHKTQTEKVRREGMLN